MGKRITRLTPEQEKLIPEIRDRWLANGLSTERIAPKSAKEAVRELYRAASLEPPELILMAQSPAQALLMRGVLMLTPEQKDQLCDQLSGQLCDQLCDQLSGQLSGQLRGQLRGQLSGQLSGQLCGQLRGQLSGQLWGQLCGQLRGQLSGQLWGQLRGQLSGQLSGQLCGQLRGQLSGQLFQSLWMAGGCDGPWLAFYEGGRMAGADYPAALNKHFDAYLKYASTCGIAFCYPKIAFVSDRPTKLSFDENRLLHCENGPAIEFPDGWSVYAWRGIRVPDEWIKSPKSLTPEIALNHENIEQRRAACEIIGWDNILTELNAEIIDADPEPEIGELVEVEIPDIGREKFLRVTCGTGRRFALPVPPEMNTALEANSWTYGVDPSICKTLEFRT